MADGKTILRTLVESDHFVALQGEAQACWQELQEKAPDGPELVHVGALLSVMFNANRSLKIE